MSMTIPTAPTSIWNAKKIDADYFSITLYAKPQTTWEQIHTWIETEYDDKHWKVVYLGDEGKDACAILSRRSCNCCDEDSEDSDDDY
jgi:hypothetical protein